MIVIGALFPTLLKRFVAVAAILAVGLTSALAVQPDEVLDDPALEARARALSADVRCLVCQNQSIDESNAPLAKDLRVLVRERLTAGDSDEAVLDYLVARYGEFVLLRPRFGLHTLVLWGVAPLLLIAGIILIVVVMRGRNRRVETASALSADERRQIERLLDD